MSWRPMAMLLIAAMLAVPSEGQRAGGGMHGGGMHGGGMHGGGMHGGGMPRSGHEPAFGITGGFRNAPFRGNFRFRNFRNFGGYGAFWIPWSYPWNCSYWSLDANGNWCGDPPQTSEPYSGSARNGSATPVIIERSAAVAPAPTPEPPKIIEAPTGKEASPSQPGPPTLFVLANGNHLEARRYMLTADFVDLEVGGQRRRVPVSQLNIQQTIAANLERGIEIKVPQDTSEVFLSF